MIETISSLSLSRISKFKLAALLLLLPQQGSDAFSVPSTPILVGGCSLGCQKSGIGSGSGISSSSSSSLFQETPFGFHNPLFQQARPLSSSSLHYTNAHAHSDAHHQIADIHVPTMGRIMATLPNTSDPFVLLNIHRRATLQEIKRAYREAALRYHPDIRIDATSTKEERDFANHEFARINAAYSFLIGKSDRPISRRRAATTTTTTATVRTPTRSRANVNHPSIDPNANAYSGYYGGTSGQDQESKYASHHFSGRRGSQPQPPNNGHHHSMNTRQTYNKNVESNHPASNNNIHVGRIHMHAHSHTPTSPVRATRATYTRQRQAYGGTSSDAQREFEKKQHKFSRYNQPERISVTAQRLHHPQQPRVTATNTSRTNTNTGTTRLSHHSRPSYRSDSQVGTTNTSTSSVGVQPNVHTPTPRAKYARRQVYGGTSTDAQRESEKDVNRYRGETRYTRQGYGSSNDDAKVPNVGEKLSNNMSVPTSHSVPTTRTTAYPRQNNGRTGYVPVTISQPLTNARPSYTSTDNIHGSTGNTPRVVTTHQSSTTPYSSLTGQTAHNNARVETTSHSSSSTTSSFFFSNNNSQEDTTSSNPVPTRQVSPTSSSRTHSLEHNPVVTRNASVKIRESPSPSSTQFSVNSQTIQNKQPKMTRQSPPPSQTVQNKPSVKTTTQSFSSPSTFFFSTNSQASTSNDPVEVVKTRQSAAAGVSSVKKIQPPPTTYKASTKYSYQDYGVLSDTSVNSEAISDHQTIDHSTKTHTSSNGISISSNNPEVKKTTTKARKQSIFSFPRGKYGGTSSEAGSVTILDSITSSSSSSSSTASRGEKNTNRRYGDFFDPDSFHAKWNSSNKVASSHDNDSRVVKSQTANVEGQQEKAEETIINPQQEMAEEINPIEMLAGGISIAVQSMADFFTKTAKTKFTSVPSPGLGLQFSPFEACEIIYKHDLDPSLDEEKAMKMMIRKHYIPVTESQFQWVYRKFKEGGIAKGNRWGE